MLPGSPHSPRPIGPGGRPGGVGPPSLIRLLILLVAIVVAIWWLGGGAR